MARAEVPNVVGVNSDDGTRYPARSTAAGKVLLASFPPDELEAALATPSPSTIPSVSGPLAEELTVELQQVRSGVDSHQQREDRWGPFHPSTNPFEEGRSVAAINLSAIATEVSHEQLVDEYLPAFLCRPARSHMNSRSCEMLPRP